MSSLKIPTCGRFVHYFPNGSDEIAASNQAEVIPALVIQSWGDTNDMVNCHIFPMKSIEGTEEPNLAQIEVRFSVHHKSVALEGQPYWDWPVIN